MVLAFSTPLSPLLFNYGVSLLSGSRVIDEDAAVATIQQGANFSTGKGGTACDDVKRRLKRWKL